MTELNRWLLPDGVDEFLPPEAWRAEHLKRRLLDLYHHWGYELISPPMIEFLESLYTGTGTDLDLQTFKLTDQLSGRLMGVRADTTPQAARIDSHVFKGVGVNRLCYANTVLHTKPESQLQGRTPVQVGCELFGCDSLASDVEVIRLMIETLRAANAPMVHIDLSHVGIYRALLEDAALPPDTIKQLRSALARKSIPDIDAILSDAEVPDELARCLRALPGMVGGFDVLDEAERSFGQRHDPVKDSLKALRAIGKTIEAIYPDVSISFDLCELRGYNYHTGLVFTGFADYSGLPVAKGGRYDSIGKEFGNDRPATGFSVDLKALVKFVDAGGHQEKIFAPLGDDASMEEVIAELRKTQIVVRATAPDQSARHLGCVRQLVKRDGGWSVEPVSDR